MPLLRATLLGLVLTLHVLFLLWVVFGYFLGRRRWWLAALHIATLAWGVIIEAGPWPCPLTLVEQHLERASGAASYQGSFLLHYLQVIVYPGISGALLIAAAVAVCAVNLLAYGLHARAVRNRRSMGQ